MTTFDSTKASLNGLLREIKEGKHHIANYLHLYASGRINCYKRRAAQAFGQDQKPVLSRRGLAPAGTCWPG